MGLHGMKKTKQYIAICAFLCVTYEEFKTTELLPEIDFPTQNLTIVAVWVYQMNRSLFSNRYSDGTWHLYRKIQKATYEGMFPCDDVIIDLRSHGQFRVLHHGHIRLYQIGMGHI